MHRSATHLALACIAASTLLAVSGLAVEARVLVDTADAGNVVSASATNPQASAFTDLALTAASCLRRLHDEASAWIAGGYQRRPALMVGLAAIFVLPLLVLAGAVLRWSLPEQRRPELLPPAPPPDPVTRTAWLEVAGIEPQRLPIARHLIQLGREADNDICLGDASVHRYHAVIECSRDAGYVITDVSGPAGNGIVVNGERRARSRLADGDLVEIGRARLRFATAA